MQCETCKSEFPLGPCDKCMEGRAKRMKELCYELTPLPWSIGEESASQVDIIGSGGVWVASIHKTADDVADRIIDLRTLAPLLAADVGRVLAALRDEQARAEKDRTYLQDKVESELEKVHGMLSALQDAGLESRDQMRTEILNLRAQLAEMTAIRDARVADLFRSDESQRLLRLETQELRAQLVDRSMALCSYCEGMLPQADLPLPPKVTP